MGVRDREAWNSGEGSEKASAGGGWIQDKPPNSGPSASVCLA